ncbi:MAG TPA: hypothetical protein EYQ86_09870 [Bacteroidetes bacterium]|nr:hypothetical protein [Bacteroidota bacterium]
MNFEKINILVLSNYRMKTFLISLLTFCLFIPSYSQLIKEYKKMGDVAFAQGDFYNAIQYYKVLIEKDTTRLELNYSYAEACRYYHNYEEAIDIYAQVIRQDKNRKYPLSYFWLADLNKTKQNYERAKSIYRQFISIYSNKNDFYFKKADHEISALETSTMINNSKPKGSIENLGIDINTSYSELSPFPLDDTSFYFTSLRVRTDQIESNEALMENRFKIFKAIKDDELWFIDEDENLMVNNPKYHIGSYITDHNNKMAIFTRCRSLNSSSVQCAIYTAEIGEDSELLNIHKLNEEVNYPGYTNTQPSIYINEEGNKALLFVSDRPGGYGKMDLWMSKLDKEFNADKAVNLGSDINTPGNELTPYFYERNHGFYFSSDWHAGIGGLDVFYTLYDIENDEYKSPVNMGIPINSSYNDLSFVMKKDSSGAFLASNRDDAFFINEEHCCHDLYDYDIQKKIKIEIEKEKPSYDSTQNILVLKGIVKDAKTKKRLTSEIELVNNNNGKLLQKIKTKQGKGNYMIILPSGGNYGIAASSPGYLFHSENLNIEDAEGFKEVKKDIDLKRIEVGSSIILNNIFFDFDRSSLREESFTEMERLYELLVSNAKLIIEISGHTDNKGSRSYNKRLSLNRAKTVVNYLIEKGIDKKRLNYKGYGFDKPIAENETEKGRQMNRRTEFKITGK